MESPIHSRTITYHRFNKPHTEIWNILSDVSQMHYLIFTKKSNMFSEPIFHQNESSTEIGSIFYFSLVSTIDIYFEVEQIIETDYWNYLQWKGYHKCLYQPLFIITISIHAYDPEHCIVIASFSQFINYQFYFSQINSKFRLYQIIDEVLSDKEQFKIQISGVVINTPFLQTIPLLLDWKTLRYHVPLICDAIEYEDEELKHGTIIRMQFYKGTVSKENEDQESDLIILKVKSLSIRDDVFVVRIVSVYKSNGIPSQEIEYTLWKVNKARESGIRDKCYYVIKHIFNEVIPSQYLAQYKQKKKQLLRQIKCYCESAIGRLIMNE